MNVSLDNMSKTRRRRSAEMVGMPAEYSSEVCNVARRYAVATPRNVLSPASASVVIDR